MSDEAFPQNKNHGIVLVISENCQDLRDLFTNVIQFGKEKIILIARIHCTNPLDILKDFFLNKRKHVRQIMFEKKYSITTTITCIVLSPPPYTCHHQYIALTFSITIKRKKI